LEEEAAAKAAAEEAEALAAAEAEEKAAPAAASDGYLSEEPVVETDNNLVAEVPSSEMQLRVVDVNDFSAEMDERCQGTKEVRVTGIVAQASEGCLLTLLNSVLPHRFLRVFSWIVVCSALRLFFFVLGR
jgi:hypothetical protein